MQISLKVLPDKSDVADVETELSMKGVLVRLQSIRDLEKKQAWAEMVESDRLRLEQQAHIDALESEVTAARTTQSEEQACWAAHRQSWCLQMEMRRRHAQKQLVERTQEHELRRDALESARQKARIVELVLERIEVDEATERRRQETRDNDEIGTMSWWRKVG